MDVYLPEDVFYDFSSLRLIEGEGRNVTLTEVGYTDIPVFVRGGSVLPLRVSGAMTTTALRETDFEILVAPNANGTASGSLYFDDGLSLTQSSSSNISFTYTQNTLKVSGSFLHPLNVNIARVIWVGRNGGALLPAQEDASRGHSNHSSDELWAQVETPPLIPGEVDSEGGPLI